MYTQNVGVAVYMDTDILIGSVSLPSSRRLSDFLNCELIGQSKTSNKFLKLTDVTICHADGTKERTETVYINRDTIPMLRTLENDSARGVGAKDGPKRYPFVHKSPVRARLRTARYELSCYVHCASGQEVSHLLAQELTFLPCTDARIREVSGDERRRAGFVAINRRQICSFQQEE